jgi:uncharacterized membrane protein
MMVEFLEVLEDVKILIVGYSILICDLTGVGILLVTVIKSAVNYFHQGTHVRLMLAQGISLALGFKLGGEVLRTLTVRDWNEFVILGAIIVLRAAITLLIHWEIKWEIAEGNVSAAERRVGKLRYTKNKDKANT